MLGLVVSVIVVAGIIAVITEMVVNDGAQPATLRRLWDRGSRAAEDAAVRWKQARAARAETRAERSRPMSPQGPTPATVPVVARPGAPARSAPAAPPRGATVVAPRVRRADPAAESAVITRGRRVRSGLSLLALVAALGAATAVAIGVTILLAGVALHHLVG